MYRLICKKPAHFLSAQVDLVSTFFQMFIVLGMYNFGTRYNFDHISELNDIIARSVMILLEKLMTHSLKNL